MKTFAAAAAALAVAMGAAGTAHAGPATDALGSCLAQSSTGKDRIVFVQWLFTALAAHPDVKSMATVTPEQRADASRRAAEVMERLLLNACATEAKAALQQDGQEALGAGFGVFGEAAANELLSHAAVEKELYQIADYIDATRWAALLSEAKK